MMIEVVEEQEDGTEEDVEEDMIEGIGAEIETERKPPIIMTNLTDPSGRDTWLLNTSPTWCPTFRVSPVLPHVRVPPPRQEHHSHHNRGPIKVVLLLIMLKNFQVYQVSRYLSL